MNEIYLLVRVTGYRDRDNRPVLDEVADLDAGFFTDRAEAQAAAEERDKDLHVTHEVDNQARRAELARKRRAWGRSLKERKALVAAGLRPAAHKEPAEPLEPRQLSFEEYVNQRRATMSGVTTTEVAPVGRAAG